MTSIHPTLPADRPADNPPPIVPVKPEDRRRWQHLLTEAITRRLTITHVADLIDDGTERLVYRVSSHSSPGTTYDVVVERYAAGATGTRCACKAAEFLSPCTHGALAMDAAGLWPPGMVIARQAALPGDDERWEFHITDRVRIKHSERTGVVARFGRIDNRPAYIVDDPEQRERLGMYLSYELEPAPKVAYVPKVDQSDAIALLTGRRAS